MSKEIKTALTFLALMSLGAVIYSIVKSENQAEENDGEKMGESNGKEKKGKSKNSSFDESYADVERGYDEFLQKSKARFKRRLDYTPYEEVVIRNFTEDIGAQNTRMLEKVSEKEIGIVQVAVSNSSDKYRKVSLWGSAEDLLSPPELLDIEEQGLIGGGEAVTESYPQGVGINPVNGNVYVVNQFSDSLSVYDSDGGLINIVKLGGLFPGTVSPVALDFNPLNGEAWVVGSVSNNIYVIDKFLALIHIIPGGRRPLAIKYHSGNGSFYVLSAVDGKLTQISTGTYAETFSQVGSLGRGDLFIESMSGKICVLSAQDSVLKIYDAENNLLGSVGLLGIYPIKISAAEEEGKVFVLTATQLFKVDVIAMNILSGIALSLIASGMEYNFYNHYLYVLSHVDGKIYIYDNSLLLLGSLSLQKPNIGIAINGANGRFYFSDTGGFRLYIAGYKTESSYIRINDEYRELKNIFSQCPGLVQHVKICFSTSEKFSNLFISKHTIAGLKDADAFSMNQYYAPQNFSNVAEVYGLRGELITSKVNWEFFIAPFQTVTFLIKIATSTAKKLCSVIKMESERAA